MPQRIRHNQSLEQTLGVTEMATQKYPPEWLERVPAVVFASLTPGEVHILLHPGNGLAQGGAPRNLPSSMVPPQLRAPNTPLWVKLDQCMNVLSVWSRHDE
jgi:hypothetical protein